MLKVTVQRYQSRLLESIKLRHANKSKKILHNTGKYWARWGALTGVLCYFQGDEGYVDLRTGWQSRKACELGFTSKCWTKPVFRHKEHTLTDFTVSSGSLGDHRARKQDRKPGTKRQCSVASAWKKSVLSPTATGAQNKKKQNYSRK